MIALLFLLLTSWDLRKRNLNTRVIISTSVKNAQVKRSVKVPLHWIERDQEWMWKGGRGIQREYHLQLCACRSHLLFPKRLPAFAAHTAYDWRADDSHLVSHFRHYNVSSDKLGAYPKLQKTAALTSPSREMPMASPCSVQIRRYLYSVNIEASNCMPFIIAGIGRKRRGCHSREASEPRNPSPRISRYVDDQRDVS